MLIRQVEILSQQTRVYDNYRTTDPSDLTHHDNQTTYIYSPVIDPWKFIMNSSRV